MQRKEPFQKSPNYQSKKNIIAGRNPVIEALRSGQLVDKILLFKNAGGEAINEIRLLAKEQNVPIQFVPVEKLNGTTNIQHQGVVAFKASVQYQDLQQVIDWVISNGETPLFFMARQHYRCAQHWRHGKKRRLLRRTSHYYCR